MAAFASGISGVGDIVEPLGASYFIEKFGWGLNWLDDHSEVHRFGSIGEITCHIVFSVYTLLSNKSKEKGEKYTWAMFLKFIALVLPLHMVNNFGLNRQKIQRHFDNPFKFEAKKKGVVRYVCPIAIKDNPFFTTGDFQESGQTVTVSEMVPQSDERPAVHNDDSNQQAPVTPPPSFVAFRLRQRVHDLTVERDELKNQLADLTGTGSSVSDFNEKDILIDQLREENAALQEAHAAEIDRLHKHHAGLQSGTKRKLSYEQAQSEKGYADGILNGGPFVQIVQRMNEDVADSEDSSRIFIGKEYRGSDSGGNLSEKESFFVKIASPGGTVRKLNSEVTDKAIEFRARLALLFLALLSGISWDDVSAGKIDGGQLFRLLFKIISHNKGMFKALLERGGYSVMKMLSVTQAVDLKVLMSLPWAGIRRMHAILRNFGIRIFPSETKMRAEIGERVEHIKEADMRSEKMLLEFADGDYRLTEVFYSNNLIGYLEAAFSKLQTTFYEARDVVWVVLSGDKGGRHMKFNFQIVHPESSVKDVHVFSLYEGSDRPEAMRQVLTKFDSAFEKFGKSDFRLHGRKVRFLLGGDYKYQDGITGISGSTGTFPCGKCLVKLDHLRNHGGMRADHECSECDCALREDSDFEELFNANIADLSGAGKYVGKLATHKQGKDHSGVKLRHLMSFIPLKNVVPPVLHITLGIVQRLFEKMLEKCRVADKSDVEAIKKVEACWELATDELIEKESEVCMLARDYLDLVNWGERLSCGTQEEIDEVACRSDSAKLVRDKETRCNSQRCVISDYDYNRLWVHCDDCHNVNGIPPLVIDETCTNDGCWYHQLCEGVPSSESTRVEALPSYSCLLHSGALSDKVSLLQLNEIRLDSLRSKQKIVEGEFYSLRTKCMLLKHECENMVGSFEKQLLKVLDDMNVDRQAYHSNAFVGNHCKIILEKFSMFCETLCLVDEDFCKKMMTVMKEFSGAHRLMTAKKMLTGRELTDLKHHCTKFGEIYPLYFPESPCLIRKMHALTFHVPMFAEEHETIGLFSEEEGETIHKIVNQKLRQYSNVRAPSQRNKLIHQDLELSCVTSRESLKTPVRKCRCGGFFVKGKCPNCFEVKT